jgi:hypothetical protein
MRREMRSGMRPRPERPISNTLILYGLDEIGVESYIAGTSDLLERADGVSRMLGRGY